MLGRCLVLLGLASYDLVFSLEDPLTCPGTYVPTGIGASKYRLGSLNNTWMDAQASCVQDRGADGSNGSTHLVVFGDMDELEAMQNIAGAREFWIGFTDQGTEGSFHWITDEDQRNDFAKAPQVPPWEAGEPNNANGENCAQLKANQLLNDSSCTTLRSFVCECDRSEVTLEF